MSTTTKLTFETGDRPPDEVEREVQAAIEAETGEPPNTYQYDGNVVWSPSGATEIDYVHDVDVPRVVRTSFNDTVDAGGGTLFERVDGRFVAVDHISSPELDLGEYVLDYFRINFGIAPWYRYSKPEDAGATTRPEGWDDWQSILSPATYEIPDLESEAIAVEGLTADDRAVRDRAVRYLAFEGTEDPERYEQLLSALPTVGERTRAVVASELWWPTPLGQGIDASLVEALLSLTDDPVPEVRIGAFMGASRAIEALHEQVGSDDGPSEAKFDAVVRQFYEAHADLLDDPDPRIRERTARCFGEMLGKEGLHIFSDDLWLRVDFPLRWRIARSAEANAHDDALGTIDDTVDVPPMAFRGEPEAVPALVEYTYDEQGPTYRAVRSMLADFAMDEPAAALDALDPALEAVEAGEVLVADVRLLAALADERPARVATVADDLVALLDAPSDDLDDENDTRRSGNDVDQDDPEEKRCAAAQALTRLPSDAHSVEQSRLLAATGDVTRERYDSSVLAPDRVAALAEVSPDTAVERLGDLPDEMRDDRDDDGFFRSNVESAVYETTTTAPEVVAKALPELVALFDDPCDASDELVVAIARTAREHPEAVAEHVDAVATCLGHYEQTVREAAATTLVVVGRERPEALSTPYSALLEREGDALDVETVDEIRDRDDRPPDTPADWPAGVLTSDPSALAESVAACLDERFPWHERLADLLREVQTGDPAVAERVLETLLDRRRSAILPSSYQTGLLTRLADTDPTLLSGVAKSLVGVLVDPDFEPRKYPDNDERSRVSPEAKSLETGLLAVARTDTATAESAIEAHYPSVEAFLDAHETDRRRDIVAHVDEAETPSRGSGADASSSDSRSEADPFHSLQSGEYGADLVVDTDDSDAESIAEEMRLVRCRVTDDDRLRQVDTGAFVRRIVGPEGPIGTVPDDADPDGEMVSVLVHSNVPDSFVRLATPEDENVLTRVLGLELDVDTFQLFTHLCHALGEEFDREDVERIERWVSQLDAIEDVEGAAELVQKQLL